MPTFGEDSDGGSFLALYHNTLNREYTYMISDKPSSNGTADSITVRTDNLWGRDLNLHCALYEYVDSNSSYMGNFIQKTETKMLVTGSTNEFATFNFYTPKPTLVSGTYYYMMVAPSGNYTGGSTLCRITNGSTNLPHCYDWSNTGITFDDPYTSEQLVDGVAYLYVTYTKTEDEEGGDYSLFLTKVGSPTGWVWKSGQFNTDNSMRATSSSPLTFTWSTVSSSINYFYPSGNPTSWVWVSGSYKGGGI